MTVPSSQPTTFGDLMCASPPSVCMGAMTHKLANPTRLRAREERTTRPAPVVSHLSGMLAVRAERAEQRRHEVAKRTTNDHVALADLPPGLAGQTYQRRRENPANTPHQAPTWFKLASFNGANLCLKRTTVPAELAGET